MTPETTPVLIVGAGPSGLVTAIELARHGVGAILVERHPATSIFPRATGVSTRSMEIFRSWGIADRVRDVAQPAIARQAILPTLATPNPTVVPVGFALDEEALVVSPTTPAVSPQDHLEPVLLDHLRSLGMTDVRFGTELVAFVQDGSGVSATLRDRATGRENRVRAGFIVGADGPRSTVRTRLGIPFTGRDHLAEHVSVLFRADLSAIVGPRPYGLYALEGGPVPGIVVPTGRSDRWLLAMPWDPAVEKLEDYTDERWLGMIRAAIGVPYLDADVLSSATITFAAMVADRYREGRGFLVGDAAHRMTPRGGRGMNTAIADAHNLGWKLAWVVRGLADAALLDTYEAERRPIGLRNTFLSVGMGEEGRPDGLDLDLGPVYRSGGIVDDGAEAAGDLFPPTARPGARAPHAWLDGPAGPISTLDVFGDGLVVVTRGSGASWRRAASVFDAPGTVVRGLAALAPAMLPVPAVPLRVVPVGEELQDRDGVLARQYGIEEGGAVLVRPDGHVVTRWQREPADVRAALAAAVDVALGFRAGPPPATVADVPGGVVVAPAIG